MSQSGTLVFFTCEKAASPQEWISRLVALSGADRFLWATRTTVEDRRWDYYRQRVLHSTVFEAEDILEESVGEDLGLHEIPSLYKEGVSLTVSLGYCPLGERVYGSLERGMPPATRGDFCPSEMSFTIVGL
jgi:hypothetical protein